ncbi:molybdenum cofactor guanylyltransferase [Salipaludibacillus sp. CUR1]|uniref:molybdenum cofactor guanylyltransferase n=1 Tax=Salipaludibacillus sp. CUR1 TaxID=2820003 RepID=UPI001E2CFAF8|nr:molybdenum cofactor guanylyltransferase [Salipaludibacillus sp. CUR1]MCE7791477.1 molybdenum cofactor guanylyltransferase [Salipaludibacillus sp. CUR1]
MELTGILLAGGKSSRMGTNKALLQIDGKENIIRLKEKLEPVAKELLLVTNDPDNYHFLKVPVVQDKEKGQGPLAGIEAGLTHSNSHWNLFVACDLPFFTTKVVEVLVKTAKSSPGVQAVVPVSENREHPLYALYHQSSLPYVRYCLENNKRRIRDLLAGLNVARVEESELRKNGMTNEEIKTAFFNMNRPEDYRWARKQNAQF